MAANQIPPLEQMRREARKTRLRLFVPVVLMLALATAGVWAGLEFVRTGEVAIPLPEKAVSFLSQSLNLGEDNKFGPIRLGKAPLAAPSPQPEPPAEPDAPSIKIPLPNVYSSGSAGSGNAGGAVSGSDGPAPGIPAGAYGSNATDRAGPSGENSFSFPQARLNDRQSADVSGAEESGVPDAANEAEAESAAGLSNFAAEPAGREIPEPSPVITAPPLKTLSGGRPQINRPDPNWKGKEPVTPYVPLTDDSGGRQAKGGADRVRARPEDRALFAEAEKPAPPPTMGKDGGPRVAVPLAAPAISARETIPATFGTAAESAAETEDSIVTLGFVKDLAAYLTSCYWPAGTHPNYPNKSVSTANIRNINQRYGVDLWGLSGRKSDTRDYYRDRKLVLSYVFMPSMLDALTRLYAERFADLLAQAGSMPIVDNNGRERRLSAQQNIAMLNYYSADARALAAALQAYAEASESALLVAEYNKALNNTNAAHTQYLDAAATAEITRNSMNSARAGEAGRTLANMETAYHARLEAQKAAENAVYKMMLKKASSRLDSSSLVYIACWINRRAAEKATILAAAASSEHIAGALAAKAEALRAAVR
jgi:hypothetical protein